MTFSNHDVVIVTLRNEIYFFSLGEISVFFLLEMPVFHRHLYNIDDCMFMAVYW